MADFTLVNLNMLYMRTVDTIERETHLPLGPLYLVRALDQIWSAFPTILMSYFAQTTSETLAEQMGHDLKEHAAIITALESGDGEEAVRLLQQHIEENRNELLSVLTAQS